MAETEAQIEAELQAGTDLAPAAFVDQPTSEGEEEEEKKVEEQQLSEGKPHAPTGEEADEAMMSKEEFTDKRRVSAQERMRQASVGMFDPDLEKINTNQSLGVPKGQSSLLFQHATTIVIDELNDDTLDFEIIQVQLPKSPISALVLMESLGIYQELDRINRYSIVCTILVTSLIQFIASATLFIQKATDDDSNLFQKQGLQEFVFNTVVLAFVVVYLAQDAAQLYKMWVLLGHMKAQDKISLWSKYALDMFIITNMLFYMFLLYYAMVEMLATSDNLAAKLQVAIAVFFIIELDDWLYNVTIEPLRLLEDNVWELTFRAAPGTRQRRFRKITFMFWGIFFGMMVLWLVLQFISDANDGLF